MSEWQTKSSKVVYENPWISVREDAVIRPSGDGGIYGVVSTNHPSVYVVPIDENGDVHLTLQERYTTKRKSWEIVAGSTDGENYETAARRELLEETGLQATNIEVLTEFYNMNGVSDAHGAICLATDLTRVSDQLDEQDGIIATRKVSIATLRDMILSGEIVDGPTITAFYVAYERYKSKEK